MIPQNFKQSFLDAAIHTLNAIVKVLLIPFIMWTKAIVELAQLKKPFYDKTVALSLNLWFNIGTFLAYPLGVLYFIYKFFDYEIYQLPFGFVMEFIFWTLIHLYLVPVYIWLTRIFVKFAVAVIKILWTASKAIVIKFYNFIDAADEAEYNNAVAQFKKKSLYDTGVTPQYGQQLITLVTCTYQVDNGRFVVVACEKEQHR